MKNRILTLKDEIKNFVLIKIVPFISKYIFRWSLKYIGSVLTYLGWTQDQWYEFIIGVITFGVGVILTFIFEKKDNYSK